MDFWNLTNEDPTRQIELRKGGDGLSILSERPLIVHHERHLNGILTAAEAIAVAETSGDVRNSEIEDSAVLLGNREKVTV